MKKFRIFIVLALCAIGMKAQEVQPQDSIGIRAEDIKDIKDINELKKSEQYVYGEVIEMVTDDNENVSLAKQKSIALMQTHIIEIFSKRLKMEPKDVQEIWDVIDEKCQNVIIKKGDLFRVISYVAKDIVFGTKILSEDERRKILSGDTTNVTLSAAPKEPEDTTAQPTPPVIVTYNLTLNAIEGGVVSGAGKYQAGSKVAIEATPAEGYNFSGWTTLNGDTLSHAQRFDYTMEAKETTLTACFVKKPTPVVEVKTPALCETIIAKKTYGQVMSFLKAEKEQQKLMYGNFNTMQYPERCYVVVVEKATRIIAAVLDKGETERLNFMTKKMDNYNNYNGGNYAVIFVQEY